MLPNIGYYLEHTKQSFFFLLFSRRFTFFAFTAFLYLSYYKYIISIFKLSYLLFSIIDVSYHSHRLYDTSYQTTFVCDAYKVLANFIAFSYDATLQPVTTLLFDSSALTTYTFISILNAPFIFYGNFFMNYSNCSFTLQNRTKLQSAVITFS